jgi:hypothetical protein
MELVISTVTLFCFSLAFIQCFIPVYVSPIDVVRIYYNPPFTDKHNNLIYATSFVGLLTLLALLLFKSSSAWYLVFSYCYFSLGYLWDNFNFLFWLVVFFSPIVFLCLLALSSKTLLKLAALISRCLGGFKKRYSLRPLHCQQCKARLKKLNSAASFLSRPQQVAMQLGSLSQTISFEVWYCRYCYEQLDREFTHRRFYIRACDASRLNFKVCPTCQEMTVVLTSTQYPDLPQGWELKEYLREYGGDVLHTYTCRCCSRTENVKSHIRPRPSDAD